MRVLSIVASLLLLAGRQALGQTSWPPGGSTTPAAPAAGVEQQAFQNAGSMPVATDDANRAQDEAAIRKLIADHNDAFNRHDGSGIRFFTDDADTRNVGGAFFTGKAEIEKLGVALNKYFGNIQRTETIQRIRFLTPDIALVDSTGADTGYIITANGTKLPPGKGGMSFKVVVKKEGRWLIAAMRNAMPGSPGGAPPGSFPGTGTPNPQSQEPLISTDDANRGQDETAIRKKIANGDEAWNRRDVNTFLANARFTENCDHISVAGNWLSGKTQVYKVFQTPTVSIHRTIESIRFITPEVAVLVVRSTYTRDNRSWDAMSIAVQHKIDGQWWAESFQNTLVKSREEAIAQAERATSPMAQTEPVVITPANSKMDFSADVATIRKRVADTVDAWNRRDAKAETSHGSQNHDHVNVIGEWRQGKAETDKAMTAALATTRNNQRGAIAKIRFITPDVAIVIVRFEYTNDKETLKSISTSVLHKMNGEWWNEAFQNTYVRPPATGSTENPPARPQ